MVINSLIWLKQVGKFIFMMLFSKPIAQNDVQVVKGEETAINFNIDV